MTIKKKQKGGEPHKILFGHTGTINSLCLTNNNKYIIALTILKT